VSGVLDEATETWTDLDEMLDAGLPPCELVTSLGLRILGRSLRLGKWRCRKPSVAVYVLACPDCGHWPKAVCAGHRTLLERIRSASNHGEYCGRCGRHLLTVVGAS
jgi:hypothetical protein